MTTDGGLAGLFQTHLPNFHFQRIETGGTGLGIPDLNYAGEGREGWIELKKSDAWAVDISPNQIGWAERRQRAGGKVLLAVRRKGRPYPALAVDWESLWLFAAHEVRFVAEKGLLAAPPLLKANGNPAKWPWPEIKSLL
jgi:hypothetical protein